MGVFRRVVGLLKPGAYGINNVEATWDQDINSCIAEAALAIHLNVWWDGCPMDFEAADVGNYQVRSTSRRFGSLIIHPRDDDDCVVVLALTHDLPSVNLRGWINCKDAKLQEFWRTDTGRPAFFVPQERLRPTEDLPPFAKGCR